MHPREQSFVYKSAPTVCSEHVELNRQFAGVLIRRDDADESVTAQPQPQSDDVRASIVLLQSVVHDRKRSIRFHSWWGILIS